MWPIVNLRLANISRCSGRKEFLQANYLVINSAFVLCYYLITCLCPSGFAGRKSYVAMTQVPKNVFLERPNLRLLQQVNNKAHLESACLIDGRRSQSPLAAINPDSLNLQLNAACEFRVGLISLILIIEPTFC